VLSRFLLTYVTEFVFKTIVTQKKIAILGYNEQAKQLAEYFNSNKTFYELAGIFGTSRQLSVDNDGNLIGNIKDCLDYAVENDITEIYSTILPSENELVHELTEVAENKCVKVRFVTTKKIDNSVYYHIDFISRMPVISLRSEPLQKTRNSMRKRIFDITVSSLAIICVLSWLTPILAILIKLSSKGPVFFKQQRSGKDNKPFWCYKFRSMTVDNENEAMQAKKNDNRITPIGAFMRKTSIDELPQFFNVFKGDMSITGPRPHMLSHTEMYSTIINKYMVRQFLKPGITGWAQVNGYRGETADPSLMEKRVEHDIWYMENWSLMLDVKILFMTVINIFKGETNAY
jgi:Undecaprenyl-phosphate glucose phosphotransferase